MKLKIVILSLILLMATAAVAQPRPTECVAEFEGMRLHYQNYGAGSEAVVLIHGWSCDHSFWRLQAPELAKQWRVIVVDMPGHGLSDKPHVEYTMKLFARSVAAVMAHAGVNKAVLAGHSMGYLVAREFEAAHPEMVKGLIIVDGAFMKAPETGPERKQYQEWQKNMTAMFAGDNYTKGLQGFVEGMHNPATSPEVRREVLDKMLATPPYVGRNAIKHFFDLENWREMTLAAPALAIFAANPDSPPDEEQQLRRIHPVLEFVMWRDAGHFFMLEKPVELNRAMVDFIAAVDLNAND